MRRPGESALLRQLFRAQVWNATPGIVVEETGAFVALWLPPGVVGMAADGDLFGGWTLCERRFERPGGILRVTEAGLPYSVLHFWDEDGSFAGWYVNLEQPLEATPLGWDFEDHLLDLWIEPDRTWRWLDEDELARAVELGLYEEAEARRIRAAGERALARARAGERPFPSGWETWRPDPGWRLPTLPPGWDGLRREGSGTAEGWPRAR